MGLEGDLHGGTIRAVGGVKSNLVLNACSIHDNEARYGGAIAWNAGNGTSSRLKIIGNTKIYNNVAAENGGGISTLSTVDLQSVEIYNNRAKNGGGLCVDTYWGGMDMYSGEGFEVKIVNGVSIHDNTATDAGGGIYMLFQPTNDVGFDAAGNPISPQFKFDMTGGSIYNNHAPIGAGVAINDIAPNRHKNNQPYLQTTHLLNPAYGKWSGEYVRNVYISGGSFYNNTPVSGSTDTKGAGIYIAKAKAAKIENGSIGYTYGDAITGGGVVTAGSITIEPTGGNIYENLANNGSGGGMYIVDEMNNVSPYYSVCNVNVGAINIYGNTCSNNGAGMFVQNGIVTVSGAKIGVTSTGASSANTATGLGGGIYVNNTQSGVVTTIEGGTKINNNGASNGAGAYIAQGKVVVQDASTEIASNTASTTGGGIYVANGNLELTNAKVNSNKATSGNGGGAYIANGAVTIDNATLSGNQATAGNGGGICVNSSSATNAISIKNGTKINGTNEALNGAGVYVAQGAVTIEGASTQISGNQATQNGGGICSMGGTININNGATIGGTKTVSGSTVADGNTAVNGGGIYASSDIEFTNGVISNNTATNGGGLYIPQCTATLDFTSGTFSANYASQLGGGIYISEGAVLNMQGAASLSGNHVPATGQGGGIYMNGTLNVGGGTGTQSMRCKDNYAGASYSLATQNNVYLPSRTKYITLKSDISHKTGGVYDTQIGITVNPTLGSGSIPVVYVEDAANEPWLYALMADISTAGGAVFDDTQSYIAIHTRRTVGGFDKQFIYFSGCWTTVVTTNPGESHIKLVGDTYHIYTNQGLAWFSSLVNGLNLGSAAPANTYGGPQPQLKAKLEADVDMGQYLWVPLGAITGYNSSSSTFTESTTQAYTGEFDGQGHVIKGINNGYLTGITRYGLFGTVGNGTVKNTFLDNYTNLAVNSGQYFMGGIAGYANGTGTVFNCEARGGMDLTEATNNSYAGGIVGYSGGSIRIHSCMAMPEMTGTANSMGGITGATNGPSKRVINCYAIPMFTNVTCGYVGGLVGWNNGQVRNCYVRLRGAKPANFGWFVAHNHFSNESNKGIIEYCYAPSGETNYVVEQNGTLTGHGNYAATALVNGKYGFAHQDQDVTLASGQSASSNTYIENGHIDNDGELKGLLSTLNNWVEDQNDGVEYSTWTRTMGSPINDDLPILEFDDFVSAGSTDNVFIAYKADLNDMIGYANGNTTGGSVYLYDATPTAVNKNTNGNVRVYIAPNVGITQAAGNTLNARVGVALDNSSTDFMAYDWHMFSSALQSAPMGLVYHGDEGTYYVRDNYATLSAQGITHTDYTDVTKMDPPMTTWNTTPGQIGYFPTDAPYGPWRNTGSLSQGFDFYCYDEPSRHWINFKREGRAGFFDHWNQYVYNPATDRHTQIEYTNESAMVSGKGYMVALSQPSMMMADGVLNNTATQSSNASYNEGSGYDQPLRGLNLVGNPYQSYLDFNQFANTNGIDTYYILDADAKGYIAYTSGSTPQESEWIGGLKRYITTRYIHPHQGFFVMVDAVQPISFNSDMRKGGTNTNVDGESSSYRDWEPRYALVNMVCTDGEGRNDFATIELDRPEQGGGRKAKGLRSGDASIWFRLGDEDYQIAFAPVGTESAPLRFEAHTDGVYTLRWNMQNADFSYLHLIDNQTGTDIDCLTTDEYRFEAKTSDYTSRFRLVFDFTGIEENDEPTEGPASFAFMMGDELIVNGEGVLQMFDLSGRQLFSTEMHGTQSSVAMPKVADGIYVLRLTNGNQVRTQKMVINK